MKFTSDSNKKAKGRKRNKSFSRTSPGSRKSRQDTMIQYSGNAGKSEPIRLNKYIANTGLCSRREADDLIRAGLITVNGKVVTELGTKVRPADTVKYGGQLLKGERKVYIVMNKPKDYVTTVGDPHAKKTVLDIIGSACKERVYPVGRLDRITTGVLLLTNDGELTKRLTHPRYNKKKIYHVFLDKAMTTADMDRLAKGIHLEKDFIRADAIHFVDPNEKKEIGLEIHSGQNRIVRRMFEFLGYRVKKLDRVYFAGLTKKGLQRGQWRHLTQKEITMLKMMTYE